MVSICEYKSTDLTALSELMTDLGYPTSVQKMRIRMEAITSTPSYFTFIAKVEDQVAGMIGLRLVAAYEVDGTSVQISALVVRENAQGQGVGRQLVQFSENWARERGFEHLHLTSGIKPERMKAHEFYKKMGFDITGYRFVKAL
jgi:GNAT superfamily N-acetyltransferase